MSPTSTIPYEVLLEVSNTTPDAVTVQVLRSEDGTGSGQAGPVIFLHKGESISLVLTAGVAYKYAIRQPLRAAELSVKIWSDTQCSLFDVFRAPSTHACTEAGIAVTEGITVTSKSSPLPSPQRQRNSRGLQNGR